MRTHLGVRRLGTNEDDHDVGTLQIESNLGNVGDDHDGGSLAFMKVFDSLDATGKRHGPVEDDRVDAVQFENLRAKPSAMKLKGILRAVRTGTKKSLL